MIALSQPFQNKKTQMGAIPSSAVCRDLEPNDIKGLTDSVLPPTELRLNEI